LLEHGPVNPNQAAVALGSRGRQADFLALAETLSSLIALIRDDHLVYVNPAGCRLLGRPKEYFAGLPFWEVVHPDDRAAAVARAAARRAGLAPKRLTERLVHADGRTIWMDYSVDLVEFDGATVTLVTGSDVTERRNAEERLRRSEANLAEAQRVAKVGSWEWDMTTGAVTWSDELFRICGLEPGSVAPSYDLFLSRVHPDDRAPTSSTRERACEDAEPFECEQRLILDGGEVRMVWTSGRVDRDAGGRPVRMYGTVQDITQRRRAEIALAASEERFRNLCTQAPVMLLSFDPSGRIRDVSNHWLQTTGFERHEVVGQEGWTFLSPDSQERLRRAIEESQRRNETVLRNVPITGICKDGRTIDLLATSVAEVSDAGEKKGAICVQINLTDLQRAEAALRESEERYRALVEHAPEAIMVLDVDQGHFVDANANAETLFGYTRERLLQMGPLDFCPERQANGRASCDVADDETRHVLAGGTSTFEFTHVTAAGAEIQCQITLSRLPAAGRRLIRASVTDITERKQLQEKIRHADRLAAAGALAAGVAHEIGNPLMALSMAAQSLERRACDEYSARKLALIREHVERISRIVRQMSELARPQSGTRSPCDVNQIVRRALDMVRYDQRSRGSEIHYDLADGMPAVEAIEDQLSQVCINLALNAFDAMAANPPERPRRLTVRSAATPGAVRVTFQDTGPGVPRELRRSVFEPFFTTKHAGRGSGLGLSVSYRILEEHQGALRLEDHDGGGATFTFELPHRGRT
jgi:PAS domain S-box-containing protein